MSEEKKGATEEQVQQVERWLDRVHWPQAFMFAMFLASIIGGPIAFLRLVPEHTQDKLFDLPWTTILTVGIPMLGVAIHGFISPFMRSVVAKAEPDAKAPPARDSQRPTDPAPDEEK